MNLQLFEPTPFPSSTTMLAHSEHANDGGHLLYSAFVLPQNFKETNMGGMMMMSNNMKMNNNHGIDNHLLATTATAAVEEDPFEKMVDQVVGVPQGQGQQQQQQQQNHCHQRHSLTLTVTNLPSINPSVLSDDEETNTNYQQHLPPMQQASSSQSQLQLPVSSPLIDSLWQQSTSFNGKNSNADSSLLWEQAKQQVDQRDAFRGHGDALEKPKRSLSAYNYFFQFERKRLLETLPQNTSDQEAQDQDTSDDDSATTKQSKASSQSSKKMPRRKIGFAAMARKISAKWKRITEQEKEPFVALAMQDSERYRREMEEWKQKAANVSTASPSPTFDEGNNNNFALVPITSMADADVSSHGLSTLNNWGNMADIVTNNSNV